MNFYIFGYVTISFKLPFVYFELGCRVKHSFIDTQLDKRSEVKMQCLFRLRSPPHPMLEQEIVDY